MRGLLALGVALCACAWAPAAADEAAPGGGRVRFASEGEVRITGETLEFESARDLYVARGGPNRRVVLRQGARSLTADWVAFSNRTRRAVASGDVIFTDGVDTLYTSFVEFEIDSLVGVMFDAEFASEEGQLELRGAEIAKRGERTYHFKEGEFTTCRCPDDDDREPWQLKAEEADLEVEGYGTARNTTLEILGVPVMWLPWMIYPLKTERQSGLLFPDFALSGRNGAEIGLPIFWAAADPVNVIFTPRWLQKRGAKGDLEIEYVLGERSGGELFGAGLYDTDVNAFSLETPFAKGRWATRGSHDFFLADDVRVKARYAFASDNSYPNDFDDLSRYRQDRFLPSRAFGMRPFGSAGRLGLVAGVQYFDDLQNPDDTDRDDFLLNRLPEARIHGLVAPLPFAQFLSPALDLRYARYNQEEQPQDAFDPALLVTADGRFLDTGVDGLPTTADGLGVEQGRDGQGQLTNPDPNFDNFDAMTNPAGTEGDGVFQEGELLADSGNRMLLHPRLGAPLRLFDLVEFYPEVGWHETLYASDADGFERDGFLTGRADLRTRLRGRFGDVVHLAEPRLGWAFLQPGSQRSAPLYVPRTAVPQQRVRELDLENVTRDWADRIDDFNGLTFAIGNRIYARGAGPDGGARLRADFELSAVYDFEDSEFGSIYLDGRAWPFGGATTRFSVGFDPERTRLSEALLAFAWADRRGDRFQLGYRFIRDIPQFFEAFPRQNDRFDSFRSDFDRVNQIDGGLRIAITRQWAISYRGVYSFERSVAIANGGGIEYLSRCNCWAARLEIRESRSRGVSINFRYSLVGLGDDSRSPFEGARRGPLSFLDGLGGV